VPRCRRATPASSGRHRGPCAHKTTMLSWLACTILQTGDMSAVQFVRCKFMMYATMSLISAAVSRESPAARRQIKRHAASSYSRVVGGFMAGLTGSPDESGPKRREKGLARSGNVRVRRDANSRTCNRVKTLALSPWRWALRISSTMMSRILSAPLRAAKGGSGRARSRQLPECVHARQSPAPQPAHVQSKQ
jgi:hypothetical protein